MILSLVIVISLLMIIHQSTAMTLFHHKYHPLPPTEFTEFNKLLFLRNHQHHYYRNSDITMDQIIASKIIKSINMKKRNKQYKYHIEYDKPPKSSFYKDKIMDMYLTGLPVYYEYGFIQKYTASDNEKNHHSVQYQKSTGLLIDYTIEHLKNDDDDIAFSIQNQYMNHDLALNDFPLVKEETNICPNGFPEFDELDFDLEDDEDEQEYNTIAYLRHQVGHQDKQLINNENNENNENENENENESEDENENVIYEEIEDNNDTDDNDNIVEDDFDYDSFLIIIAVLVQLVISSKCIDIVKGNSNKSNEVKYESPFDDVSNFSSLLTTISCPNSPIRIARSPVRNPDKSPIRFVFNN